MSLDRVSGHTTEDANKSNDHGHIDFHRHRRQYLRQDLQTARRLRGRPNPGRGLVQDSTETWQGDKEGDLTWNSSQPKGMLHPPGSLEDLKINGSDDHDVCHGWT